MFTTPKSSRKVKSIDFIPVLDVEAGITQDEEDQLLFQEWERIIPFCDVRKWIFA